ncbi:hypothetical protein Dimus_005627 [Dionaea muscipula]
MSGGKSSMPISRDDTDGNLASWVPKGDGIVNSFQDQETTGLYARLGEQENEISALRWQVARAYIDEMQQLNEKYALERKVSDLQMAMDEKQKEFATSVSKELAQRKGDLDHNIKLISNLKDEEDERYIFMTSLLGLLAEYDVWPNISSASAICLAVKHLHSELQWKIKTLDGENESSPSSHQEVEQHLDVTDDMRRYMDDNNILDPRSLVPNDLDEGPGIEGFQVVGDARPGGKLLGCGYPIRGTSLCMFQWVRHLDDGTSQYIEGATNPDYAVTADDVDKYVAVNCVPMDDKGRQGKLVRVIANNENKITCDPDMQLEIDTYLSKGHATFSILMLVNTAENWEPATLTLKRSGFQVKINETGSTPIFERFSKDLLIKIPSGISSQFVLTIHNGSSHPFSTHNDVRKRDTIVLTMRMFQSKVLDDMGKGIRNSVL